MKLEQDAQAKLINKLNLLWTSKKCEICSSENWKIDDTLFEIREFHKGDVVLGGAVKPIVTVMCSNCGNTKFLNAIQLGIIDKQLFSEEKKKGGIDV